MKMHKNDLKIKYFCNKDEYDELRKFLSEKIEINSGDKEKYLYFLALSHFADEKNGDIQKGMDILDSLIQKSENNGEYKFWRSYISYYLFHDDYKLFNSSKEMIPLYMPNELKAYVYMFLSEHEMVESRYFSALEYVENSLRIIPNIARCLITKAQILLQTKKKMEARIILNNLTQEKVFYDIHNLIMENMINGPINDAKEFLLHREKYKIVLDRYLDYLLSYPDRYIGQDKQRLRFILMALRNSI